MPGGVGGKAREGLPIPINLCEAVNMARAFFFPVLPGQHSGYECVVSDDVSRLRPRKTDRVQYAAKAGWVRKLLSLLCLRPTAFRLNVDHELIEQVESLFIGDVVLVVFFKKRHLNSPKTTIRFHNLYLRVLYSHGYFGLLRTVGLFPFFTFLCVAFVERIALTNSNALFDFISQEDKDFAISRFHIENYIVNPIKVCAPPKKVELHLTTRLIWLGNLGAHKSHGLRIFIRDILPVLRSKNPNYHLELFGKGTEIFSKPERGVFGRGFYPKSDLPYGGNGIFIVPDTLGIGVKVKIKNMIEKGAHIIGTPESVIGYSTDILEFVKVAPLINWPDVIVEMNGTKLSLNHR